MSIDKREIRKYLVDWSVGPDKFNDFRCKISLHDESNAFFASIRFIEAGADVPSNKRLGGDKYRVFHTIDEYPQLIDLLRHEAPLFFYFYESSQRALISTSAEPVGEGDADADAVI